jgi:hypothetical protein
LSADVAEIARGVLAVAPPLTTVRCRLIWRRDDLPPATGVAHAGIRTTGYQPIAKDSEPEEPARTNVVDLMAALKLSLGQAEADKKPPPAKKSVAKVTPMKPPQAAAKRKRA